MTDYMACKYTAFIYHSYVSACNRYITDHWSAPPVAVQMPFYYLKVTVHEAPATVPAALGCIKETMQKTFNSNY